MDTTVEPVLREQLLDRRAKLGAAISDLGPSPELGRLLVEVDAALERMEREVYGLCDICHDAIEADRLIADPLVSVCLGHMSAAQRAALEEDLQLAARIQRGLLPPSNLIAGGWSAAYHYEPLGPVSGDYCDLIRAENGDVYFLVGDVSGKGVAASMLMSHLQAMFHTLVSVGLPLNQIVERASRVFCESTLPTHFATLVAGRAGISGDVEICNAGHLPVFLIQAGEVSSLESSGLPVGLFCEEHFVANRVRLFKDDSLLLYTDGFSEAQNSLGDEYGRERLRTLAAAAHTLQPEELVRACLRDLSAFQAGMPKADDLTLMVLRRLV